MEPTSNSQKLEGTRCSACGFQNPPGMRFCGGCGTRLVEGDNKASLSETVGVMMGADLSERLRRAGIEATGQRRNVTILFVDICDYTPLTEKLDSEDVYHLVRQFIQKLAKDVYKFEGAIDKLTGDGLMALFGAPLAHENNAELAVRSAMDMLTDVAAMSQEIEKKYGQSLNVRIGLNSGTVIVGGIDADLVLNYTALGNTVNLASRLENAGQPGSITVSESVYRQVKALFECNELAPLSLKGIAQPVVAYRLVGEKRIPGSVRGIEGLHAPMIGRDTELRELLSLVDTTLLDRNGRFVLISGEAGIGKSRLVGELKANIEGLPFLLLEGHAQVYRRSSAYAIFIDLIQSYLEVNPDLPARELQEQLRVNLERKLGQAAEETLPFFRYLFSTQEGEESSTDPLRFLEAGQLQQQIFLAIRSLLMAEMQKQPLIVVLDDLHWADEASIDLILYLFDTIKEAPLILLGASRPIQEGRLAQLAETAANRLADRFKRIDLDSLDEAESQLLLQKLLLTTSLPADSIRAIVQRSGGIPFYLEEVLRTLIDDGYLVQERGAWHLEAGPDAVAARVPESLEGLILTRYDHLNEAQRQVLQYASVIGRQFMLPVMMAALPSSGRRSLQNILASLMEREFITFRQVGAENIYLFRHGLVADAIYNTLLRQNRSEIHLRVASAIEEQYADRLESQIEILAYHYRKSLEKEKAFHYLLLAGQKSARTYANQEARFYFEHALELMPDVESSPEQVLGLRRGLGDVLGLMGEYQAARDQYSAGLDLVTGLPSEYLPEKSRFLRRCGGTYERQGDYELALKNLYEAQELLDKTGISQPVEKARILNDIGWIHNRRGDQDAAELYFTQALPLVETTDQYDIVASIYNRLGGVSYQKDQLERASDLLRKSVKLREEIGDKLSVARSYNNLGLLEWKRGNWDAALESFQRSVQLHSTLGDVEGSVTVTGNLGLLYADRGNVDESKHYLYEALTTADRFGYPYHSGVFCLHLSRLYVAVSNWFEALKYANRSLDILTKIGAQDNMVDIYTMIGWAWLGLGELARAEEWGKMLSTCLRTWIQEN